MKFIDSAKIYLKAGDGGQGCVSFHRAKFIEFGGPDGGEGGKGGDIYIRSLDSYHTLIDFRYRQHFKAEKGKNGAGRNRSGAKGKDLIIDVPVGTIIYNEDKSYVIHDFKTPNEKILICKSGIGGKGNSSFKTSTNRAPTYAQKGTEGEEAWIWLELEILADVGIIGLPNAGKSSLIGSITNSKSKVGNYPFTTLMPQLGVLFFQEQRIIIADLPGILENASEGIGLGDRFLAHIKRCKAFIHMIDISEDNFLENYKIVRKELHKSNPEISSKYEIVVLNKIDLITKEELEEKIELIKSITSSLIIPVSVSTKENLNLITSNIVDFYTKNNQKETYKPWHPLI